MDLPFISTMIVVRNGEKIIARCLESLIKQDYPKDKYEILVIDGMSDDDTTNIVRSYSTKDNKIRLLSNPKKILASGWNIGIKEARGSFVVRLDAHATANSDFIRKNVETLLRMPDVACVGGSMETKSTTALGYAISSVLSSPFGVGDSKFRTSKKAQYVDTVAYGMYRREVILQAGGLNEGLTRNQDMDLHGRIKRAGWQFYLEPSIKTTYFARERYSTFVKQAWQNGWWNIISFSNNRDSLALRHLIPLFFVLGIIGLGLGTLIWETVIYVIAFFAAIYVLLSMIATILNSKKWWHILLNPFLFLSLHISYGLGSLASSLNLISKSRS